MQTDYEERELAVLAGGLLTTLTSAEPSALEDLARWSVDRRHYRYPRRLTAPSAAWLGDSGFEEELRAAVEGATQHLQFAGLTQEKHYTGALLKGLEDHLVLFRHLDSTDVDRPVPDIKYTETKKVTESRNNADLGLLVDTRTAGLQARRGHLVQIKRSADMEDSTRPR